ETKKKKRDKRSKHSKKSSKNPDLEEGEVSDSPDDGVGDDESRKVIPAKRSRNLLMPEISPTNDGGEAAAATISAETSEQQQQPSWMDLLRAVRPISRSPSRSKHHDKSKSKDRDRSELDDRDAHRR